MTKLCKKCVNLINDNEQICPECQAIKKIKNYEEAFDFTINSIFYKNLKDFIKSRENKSILYAFSGGQDSTAVLYLLKKLCTEYNVTLKLFTIENGFKGKNTWNNINNVIDFLELKDNFKIYDIRKNIVTDEELVKIFGKENTVEEIYSLCFIKNILPCGKICNRMMDNQYKKILEEEQEEYLITGGDTPKLYNGELSIQWQKNSGIKIIRGGAGLRITKNIGKKIIEENNIPWKNPNYGGYDTDCLIPGSIFASINNGNSQTNPEEIKEKYRVVLEYLKERSRMEIIDRESAIKDLYKLDLNSYTGYIEAKNIASKVLTRKLDKNVQN